MDLNTALMEITSMSECFVASNMRTSFTDLAETGSLSSNLSTSQSTGSQSANNEFHKSSNDYHHHTSKSSHQIPSSLSQLQNLDLDLQQQLHHRSTVDNNHHNHQHQNRLGGGSHHNNHNQIINNQLGSLAENQHQSSHSHQANNQNMANQFSSNLHQHSYPANSIPHHRLPQPIRTQIPIHCYIEQLDACADLPGYNPSITDNELFSTSDKPMSNSHRNNQSNNSNQYAQSHLHQSKLALESVTNCNGLPSNSLNRNDIGTGTSIGANLADDNINDSDNNIDDIDNYNNTTNVTTSSSSLFQDTEVNNNAGDDDLDTNLDHLNPDSPSSVHHQLPIHQDSSDISASFNNPATSSSYETHHFQSCRETYAIVTSNVLYIDLLRTVLLQLGYSAMDLINAKATIQIKNWKPLGLDQVTDDKEATVGEVLGDISTFVTLRIRLYSTVTQLPTEWTETMIRQVVLALTQTMSQLTLSKLCNISQPLISSIVRGGKKLGRRKCAEFGQWYMNYIKTAEARPSTMFCEGGGARLVFDKAREIPQLKAWFANNTKPSDELLEEYSRVLNEHALRKDRPQVTAKALRNWWKNERQKLGIRQREIRGRPKLKRIE